MLVVVVIAVSGSLQITLVASPHRGVSSQFEERRRNYKAH